MLSSILDSESAIQTNIRIMRIFIRLRQILIDNTELKLEVERIKTKLDVQDKNIEVVFCYLNELSKRLDNSESEKQPRKSYARY